MSRLPNHIKEELGHYVYRLVDPRDGRTFYVGKGQGDRIFDQHAERDIPPGKTGGRMSARQILREIKQDDLKPVRIVHRWGMDRDQAFHVEKALIAAYPGTVNRRPRNGPRNIQKFIS